MKGVRDWRAFPDVVASTAASPLPDLLAKDLAVVFCGLNPGLKAAASGHHFQGRNNRFWKVLCLAGFTPELMQAENDKALLSHGCGLTTAVVRATARADQLSAQEFRESSADLLEKIEHHRPAHVAFLGKAAYAAISGQRHIAWGQQPGLFGTSQVWVLPNPSGLNRSFSLDDLVEKYRELYLSIDWQSI